MQRKLALNEKTFQYLTISYSGFIDAVKNGESDIIDDLLAAKKHGSQLDLDKGSENALEILLQKKDFINAKKLIQAGADTGVIKAKWVADNGPYPHGSYQYIRRDFFEEFAKEKEVIEFLKEEAPEQHAKYFKQLKTTYNESMNKHKLLPKQVRFQPDPESKSNEVKTKKPGF